MIILPILHRCHPASTRDDRHFGMRGQHRVRRCSDAGSDLRRLRVDASDARRPRGRHAMGPRSNVPRGSASLAGALPPELGSCAEPPLARARHGLASDRRRGAACGRDDRI